MTLLRRAGGLIVLVGALSVIGMGSAAADWSGPNPSCGQFCGVQGSACTVTHIGSVTVLSGDCKP